MKKALKVLLWIAVALLVIAIGAFCVMRFIVMPKISDRLRESGRGELAELVEQNNNLGTFASMTGILTDKGMIEFATNLDGEMVSSAVEVLDDIEAETKTEPEPEPEPEPLPQPSSPPTVWKVQEATPPQVIKPVTPLKPSPTPSPTAKPAETADSAYDRIASTASSKEISDGLAILSKIDMGYVSKLLSGGITEAEKSELKKYIYGKLSGSEISRALQLYNKYKKYL